jgi:hypothetical protein
MKNSAFPGDLGQQSAWFATQIGCNLPAWVRQGGADGDRPLGASAGRLG